MIELCDCKHDRFILVKFQGALVGVDGEMASKLLGRLDERTSSKKRFVFIQNFNKISLLVVIN